MNIFKEIKDERALPKHQLQDYKIKLIKGTELLYSPLYRTLEEDLRILKEFINKYLKKGYIRELSLPAGSLTLFVLKADSIKRLYIDYQRINNLTIKDRYILLLVDDLQDRLRGVKIFTQLDLQEGYHLIRMKEGKEWKTAFRTPIGYYKYLVI